MARILRDLVAASRKEFDIVIVGGGIYGAMLAIESVLHGLRTVLVERGDFGGATSFNSLRIIHGGFRYLQTLDLKRFMESVAERRWFLRTFPELVAQMPCLMPLYGKGLRRKNVLRAGLITNAALSVNRNSGVHPKRRIPNGRIINSSKIREIFPMVESEGLQGGVIWYDGFAPDSQRIIIEILKLACENGAMALNYTEAVKLLKSNGTVSGVLVRDTEKNCEIELKTKTVVNAAGPWCRDIASKFDRDYAVLFQPSLVWNVLLDRKALSSHALAIAPQKKHAQTYFIVPWKGRMLAGTGHALWKNRDMIPKVSEEQLEVFIDDINQAVPGIDLSIQDIRWIFPGLQPAVSSSNAKLSHREVILNHSNFGGPQGLYSISGVKFTTARLVAEKTIHLIYPDRRRKAKYEVQKQGAVKRWQIKNGANSLNRIHFLENSDDKDKLIDIIDNEAVQHLEDLVFRRTNLWENFDDVIELAPELCNFFQWDENRCYREISNLSKALQASNNFNLPSC